MPLTPGSRLGHYEIGSAIGVGGMGEVYRAHDARLRRDVAIKVLPQAFAADEERLRRFEQEALATAALNHPNILVGRRLDYIGRDRRLMSVTVERADNTLRVGTPQPLFEVHAVPENGLGTRAIYDVTRDGQRFIVAEDRDERPEAWVPIAVLVDWKSRVVK